jgi:hypothetical protein
MALPVRRTAEDGRKLALAPTYGPLCYIHHNDGSWLLVGDDGWPISPEDYYAGLEDARATVADVTCAPVDVELLTAVRHGLLSMQVIDVEPISVRDLEV